MTKTNGTLKYRVGQLEKYQEDLHGKIDEIRTNHLPHIELSIVALKTRMNVMTAINVGAIAAAVLLQWALTTL